MPLSEKGAVASGGEPDRTGRAGAGAERILFVDDEKPLVDVARWMLSKWGFQVTGCTSSREALSVFRNRPEGFDLIVTDQTMPQMTGFELAGACMAVKPGIPVILCTGFSESVTPDKARMAGIRAFVMKPLVTEHLVATIRRVLDGGDDFPDP